MPEARSHPTRGARGRLVALRTSSERSGVSAPLCSAAQGPPARLSTFRAPSGPRHAPGLFRVVFSQRECVGSRRPVKARLADGHGSFARGFAHL